MGKIIRCSSIDEFEDCQRRCIARNFEAEHNIKLNKVGSIIGSLTGTANHKAVETMNDQKRKTGKIDQKLYIEAGLDNLSDEIVKAGNEIIYDSTTPERNVAEMQVRRMSNVYENDIANHINVIESEKEVNAEIKEGWILSGHLDQVTDEGLRDLKTGKISRWHINQIGTYSFLRKIETDHAPKSAKVDFVKRVGKTAAQPNVITKSYPVDAVMNHAIGNIKNIIKAVDTMIRTGDIDHINTNLNSMMCSKKYCPAFGTEFCKISKIKGE